MINDSDGVHNWGPIAQVTKHGTRSSVSVYAFRLSHDISQSMVYISILVPLHLEVNSTSLSMGLHVAIQKDNWWRVSMLNPSIREWAS